MCLPFILWASFLLSVQPEVGAGNENPGVKKQITVSNTPFFDDNYKYSDLTLGRGRRITSVKTKIDLYNNITQFISFNGVEIVLDPGAVKEVSYADTTAEGIVFYKFRTGFPVVDGKTANSFYRVLADGNCSILHSIEKKLFERKRDVVGNLIKEYETYEYYYIVKKMR